MPISEGTPVWFELNAGDPDAAQAFYEAVAGWHVAPSPMPEHGGYRIGAADGRAHTEERARCRLPRELPSGSS